MVFIAHPLVDAFRLRLCVAPILAPLYRAAGHPQVLVLPHAVDADLFPAASIREGRSLDLGWVGAFNYAHYDRRKRIVQRLLADSR